MLPANMAYLQHKHSKSQIKHTLVLDNSKNEIRHTKIGKKSEKERSKVGMK